MLLAAAAIVAAQDPPKIKERPPEAQQPAEPQEEDASAKPKEYTFNPIQADNELKVGKFYMKGGKFKSAAGRFDEALKWNPGLSEAWLLLGEAREKMKDAKGARQAYEKYLEADPDSKMAPDVKKRLSKLGKS
jgi:tetratricopeptide (TPR) repeat protein